MKGIIPGIMHHLKNLLAQMQISLFTYLTDNSFMWHKTRM